MGETPRHSRPRGRFGCGTRVIGEIRAPVESGCACYTCVHFSRAYLHHLFQADEMLGPTLLSLHNIAFYLRLMADARQAIEERRFAAFHSGCLARWTNGT